MRAAFIVVVVVVSAVSAGGLAACGGGESSSSPADQAAATKAVQSYVDDSSCELSTERLLKEYYPGSNPKADCAADQLEGMRKGDYKLSGATVGGEQATVRITRLDGAVVTYSVVKQDGKWLVDASAIKPPAPTEAKLGQPQWVFSQQEINGVPIDGRLKVTVLSAKPTSAPDYAPPASGKEFWRVKARVLSESSKTIYVSVNDFYLVTAQGERYIGTPIFEPPIGNNDVNLAPGDTVTGYAGFEIPKKARIARVEYSPSCCSDRERGPLKWAVR